MFPTLSLSDTQALKGVALLMLLAHHCLMDGRPYDDISVYGHHLVAGAAAFCKLCVAMFVFLSGYGLTVSTERRGGLPRLADFYRRRFTRLMVPYWVIWALFVPLGVFVMGRTMEGIYHTHIAAKAVADFLGLFNAVTGSPFGYNATWWFYSCIIPLYVAFPLLYRCRHEPLTLLAAALMFDVFSPGVPLLYAVKGYATAFTVGIMSATRRITPPNLSTVNIIMTLAVCLAVCLCRHRVAYPSLWDALTTLLIVAAYRTATLPRKVAAALETLGRHSANIFLFHTFIYAYYFQDLVYWSRNPALVYLTLLAVCLPLSMAIERLKRLARIDRLTAWAAGEKRRVPENNT